MNLIGNRFGKWTVKDFIRSRLWECICDCGTISNVYETNLVSGKSKQCRKCYDTRPIDQRLWPRLQIAESGCWIWKGSISDEGYGRLVYDGESYAHRVMWALCFGAIPKDLCVCHHCDNPPCVNPIHLFLGTDAENLDDMHKKGRWWVPIGEKSAASKLEDSEASEIRLQRQIGIPVKYLAQKYGVCESTISKIALHRRRQHVV